MILKLAELNQLPFLFTYIQLSVKIMCDYFSEGNKNKTADKKWKKWRLKKRKHQSLSIVTWTAELSNAWAIII